MNGLSDRFLRAYDAAGGFTVAKKLDLDKKAGFAKKNGFVNNSKIIFWTIFLLLVFGKINFLLLLILASIVFFFAPAIGISVFAGTFISWLLFIFINFLIPGALPLGQVI